MYCHDDIHVPMSAVELDIESQCVTGVGFQYCSMYCLVCYRRGFSTLFHGLSQSRVSGSQVGCQTDLSAKVSLWNCTGSRWLKYIEAEVALLNVHLIVCHFCIVFWVLFLLLTRYVSIITKTNIWHYCKFIPTVDLLTNNWLGSSNRLHVWF